MLLEIFFLVNYRKTDQQLNNANESRFKFFLKVFDYLNFALFTSISSWTQVEAVHWL